VADGVRWDKYAVKFVTAGEVFSEEWRSLMCERLGTLEPAMASASLYGTADGGVLAAETPLSIQVRRFLSQNPAAASELFGQTRLPTLCQYDPLHRAFEVEQGELLFSGDGGVPLVRYQILDQGGIFEFHDLMERLKDYGFDASPGLAGAREQPFVFVFGRSRFATSFYGANVYPENVAPGLERREIAPWVTGKFVVGVFETAEQDRFLEVVVELGAGVDAQATLADSIAVSIQTELERVNSEFLNYVPAHKRRPRIQLLALGTPSHFPAGVKHRYTR
jgi:phenylacetate-CoA ligase